MKENIKNQILESAKIKNKIFLTFIWRGRLCLYKNDLERTGFGRKVDSLFKNIN